MSRLTALWMLVLLLCRRYRRLRLFAMRCIRSRRHARRCEKMLLYADRKISELEDKLEGHERVNRDLQGDLEVARNQIEGVERSHAMLIEMLKADTALHQQRRIVAQQFLDVPRGEDL